MSQTSICKAFIPDNKSPSFLWAPTDKPECKGLCRSEEGAPEGVEQN